MTTDHRPARKGVLMRIPPYKVRKSRDGLWHTWHRDGRWIGASAHWYVALALALGEPCDLPDGSRLGFDYVIPGRR